MSQLTYEPARILIWGKTYPELSAKYVETVCTAGVFEDGRPVRLYPIDFRYLQGASKFKKYQWISAAVAKNPDDKRPESYKIERDSIRIEGGIKPTPKDEWALRAAVVFNDPSWQFESVEDLKKAERASGRSLGVVVPKSIERIEIRRRPAEEAKNFAEKLKMLKAREDAKKAQLTFFEETIAREVHDLDFVEARFVVHWRCHGRGCTGHQMQILDWEIVELHRRDGDVKAMQKLEEILDLKVYSPRFFLGNLHHHPTSFLIVGIWYPKRAAPSLFD